MTDNKTILKEELERLRDDIIQRQKDTGEYASGKTASGYEVAVESEFHAWLGGYSYVGVLERGRRPGKVPMYFKEIIKRWIIAKGLQSKNGKSLDRMAASIAWVIHMKGTVLHRNGIEMDIFTTPIKDFTERTASKLSILYRDEIINQIFK
jgi:hypothetical protein